MDFCRYYDFASFSFFEYFKLYFATDLILKLSRRCKIYSADFLQPVKIQFYISGYMSKDSCLFFFNLFDRLFGVNGRFFFLKSKWVRSLKDINDVFSRAAFTFFFYENLFRIFYFLLFFYIPVVLHFNSSRYLLGFFSVSAFFPNFFVNKILYSDFVKFKKHYILVARRLPFLVFASRTHIIFDINFSGFNLRDLCHSYIMNDDWSVWTRFFLKKKREEKIPFIFLGSFLKFFLDNKVVVKKKFL